MSWMPSRSALITRRGFGKLAAAGGALATWPGALAHPAWAQRQGGTLVVSLLKDLPTINPMVRFTANSWRVTPNFYNNLTQFDAKGMVAPDLAESWEASEGATIWTFRLRKGVKFHDGSAFGAADVKATFDKMMDPATAAPYLGEMGPLAEVIVVDEHTVRFRLSGPFADLPSTLATSTGKIISRKGIAEFDKVDRMPFGTGPFLLKEFVPNDRLVMEGNPDYFGGPPRLDRVVVRLLPDVTAQVAALQNREIDAIGEVEGDTFKRLANARGVKLVNLPGGTFNNLILYAHKPPFDNPKLRLAVKMAMDRVAIAAAMTEATGLPADDHPLSPVYDFFDAETPLRQPDLAEARRLMREAGQANGFEHKVVVAANPPSRQKLAVLCQAMAAQIGVNFKLELMDNARFLSTTWNKGTDSYVGNYVTRPSADAILTKLYHDKLGQDEGRWATPESNKMLEAARATTDRATRQRLYRDFQRLSRDNGPFIIAAFFNSLAAHNDYVNELPLSGIGLDMRFDKTWLSEAAPKRG